MTHSEAWRDLYKMGLVNIPSYKKEELLNPHPSLRDCWLFMDAGGEGIIFSRGVASVKLPRHQ